MIIYLKKPSKDWKRVLPDALSGIENLLIIRIGFAEYPKANKGIFKKKVVLGTDHEHEIRFLSAEDKPVEVLQLTGMVLNRNGDVLRAGAEGIVHEDAPFWAQVFDIQKSMDDKTVNNLISKFRIEDLPGKPLAWKAALDTLLRQLISENK
ncbi:MAG: hypothetical protein KDD04_12525 [Sinomicrobium sp.]|nr:hypothetical protein [Sinomicrobium sp.]